MSISTGLPLLKQYKYTCISTRIHRISPLKNFYRLEETKRKYRQRETEDEEMFYEPLEKKSYTTILRL